MGSTEDYGTHVQANGSITSEIVWIRTLDVYIRGNILSAWNGPAPSSTCAGTNTTIGSGGGAHGGSGGGRNGAVAGQPFDSYSMPLWSGCPGGASAAGTIVCSFKFMKISY